MYIKIDNEGNIAEIANNHYIIIDDRLIINPKREDYAKLGFYPILNPDAEPEYREGYYAEEYYVFDEEELGFTKTFRYIKIDETNEN